MIKYTLDCLYCHQPFIDSSPKAEMCRECLVEYSDLEYGCGDSYCFICGVHDFIGEEEDISEWDVTLLDGLEEE